MKETLYNSESGSLVCSNVLGDFRAHASRTMMFSELELLLDAVPAGAYPEEYRQAVLEENVLLKGAATTRAKSWRHLRELYILDESHPLFRTLRMLWAYDPQSR